MHQYDLCDLPYFKCHWPGTIGHDRDCGRAHWWSSKDTQKVTSHHFLMPWSLYVLLNYLPECWSHYGSQTRLHFDILLGQAVCTGNKAVWDLLFPMIFWNCSLHQFLTKCHVCVGISNRDWLPMCLHRTTCDKHSFEGSHVFAHHILQFVQKGLGGLGWFPLFLSRGVTMPEISPLSSAILWLDIAFFGWHGIFSYNLSCHNWKKI